MRVHFITFISFSPFINVVKGFFFVVRVTLVPVSYIKSKRYELLGLMENKEKENGKKK